MRYTRFEVRKDTTDGEVHIGILFFRRLSHGTEGVEGKEGPELFSVCSTLDPCPFDRWIGPANWFERLRGITWESKNLAAERALKEKAQRFMDRHNAAQNEAERAVSHVTH